MRRHALICIVLALCVSLSAQVQQGGPADNVKVKPFRFAQLTDVHLNPNSDGPTKALLASIEQINQTDSIDFVLVTGDLTEQGDTRMMQQVKACLDRLNRPYHVCMGNHETTWSESGCTGDSRIFGPEYFSMDFGGVHFVFFNTGPLLKLAYGHVSPYVYTWAARDLQAHRDMPAIVVTHYPLTEGDVDNWYDVTDALRRLGNIRLFIGGHYHALRTLRYDGMPGILMRSNLPDEEGKPGYGIYEVDGKEIRAYIQRVGEEKMHAPCMLPERDGIVYGSTNDGVSFALEGRTGRLLWRHKTGNSLMNTLVPIGHREVLYTNTEGSVGRLKF